MSEEMENNAAIDAAALEQIARENAAPDQSAEVTAETAAPEISNAEILHPIISLAADKVAPNWNVTEEEKEALAGVYGGLMDKYLPPDLGGQYGPELGALVVTGSILLPRMGTPAQLPPPKEEIQTESRPPPEQVPQNPPPVKTSGEWWEVGE